MEGFAAIDAAEAQDIARTHFGLSGVATRFPTEKDDTFRIDQANGERLVLKVSNPRESIDELDFQTRLVRHVCRVAPELPVAPILDSLDGTMLVGLTTRAGEQRTARLYDYVHGTPLDTLKTNALQRQQIGHVLARLRLTTATFQHPAQHRELAWDVMNFAKLRPLTGSIADPVHRRLIEKAFDRFNSIADQLSNCPAQVLHNDFNRSNIVVDTRGGSNFIAGIIDFGDAVHTAVAIDVATALMNQFPLNFTAQRDDDLFADSRDVLLGYLAHAPLTEFELRLIPHLAMARGATRALLSTWRAQLFPHNAKYILRFTTSDWIHLRWLLEQDEDALSETLLGAY